MLAHKKSSYFYLNARRSFTLVEVIIASVIFIIAAAGVLSTIGLMNSPSLSNSSRITAMTFAKKVADGLHKDVKSGITAGNLSVGAHGVAADPLFPGFTASYVVSLITTDTNGLRKVDVTVTW